MARKPKSASAPAPAEQETAEPPKPESAKKESANPEAGKSKPPEPEPYALVHFTLDSKTVQVPQRYIEAFQSSEWDSQKVEQVFWSPETNQTPDDILRSNGIILHLEEEDDNKRGGDVLAGYYRAFVLKIAESQSALVDLLAKKRVQVPSRKIIDSKKAKKETAKKDKKRDPNYVSKGKLKVLRKKSDNITSDLWSKRYDANGTDTEDNCDSDDSLMTKGEIRLDQQLMQQENDSLKRKNQELTLQSAELNQQNADLKRSNAELLKLNLFWQRKCADAMQPETSPSIGSVRKNLFNEVGFGETSNPQMKTSVNVIISPKKFKSKSLKKPKEPVTTSNRKAETLRVESLHKPCEMDKTLAKVEAKSSSIQTLHQVGDHNSSLIIKEASLFEKDLLESHSSISEHQPLEKNNNSIDSDPLDNYHPTPNSETSDEEEEDYEFSILTPEMDKIARRSLGKSATGDKRYVKQLAMAIFGPQLLMQSSYSGRAAVGGKKKLKLTAEAQGRPALPEREMEELTAAFKRRIYEEYPKVKKNSSAMKAIVAARMCCFQDSISDKIKYLRLGLNKE